MSKLYVAGRYTNAMNESDGVNDENVLQRIQVAAGYWIRKNTLLKLEFVNQDEEENSGGQIGGGFDGVVTEVSVKL